MSRSRRRTPLKLLQWFLVATLVPAGVLLWLGWRLVEQDRLLERQRVAEYLESTANLTNAALERELGRIERQLGALVSSQGAVASPADAIVVRLDAAGLAARGTRVLFEPGRVPSPFESATRAWAQAERLEFGGTGARAAIAAYQALTQAADAETRANALMRLARILRRVGRGDEALSVYDTLAEITSGTVRGDPPALIARWARVDLLAALSRDDLARQEAVALERDLRAGHWPLDRTTSLSYLESLRPWRTAASASELAAEIALSDAVAAVWRRRQERGYDRGGGRAVLRTGDIPVLTVWREDGDALQVFAATPAYLAREWAGVLSVPHVAIALVDEDGNVVAGEANGAFVGASVRKTAAETRLPWTLRIAATSTPSAIGGTGATTRSLLLAVLALVAVLVPATGVLVMMAVRRELAAARQQADFVAAVSHELRSPLTALTHLTSLLRSDFQPSEARRREYYDVLASETDRLRRFVESILDFGRMQAGARSYHRVPIELNALIRDVVADFKRRTTRPAEVSVISPAAPIRVSADAEALRRALWNLLENAAKYSSEGSPIAVTVKSQAETVVIQVRDHGVGIPEAEQPLVFDQFYRGTAAIESAVPGTGVGLAIVRHIVRGHGGDVRVESMAGAGSTFTVTLPVVGDQATGRDRGSAAS